MNTAFIFPGQGSQAVGMGKDLYNNFSAAKEIFDQVDDVLEQNLTKLIFDGPLEDLSLTENTQPALMAVSMAFLNVMKLETGKDIKGLCDITAGHSVGEYSALCAAGSISIKDAARILKIRGNAMQNSCPQGKGAMAACLGLGISDIEQIVASANKYGICDIANDNTSAQIVISGEVAAVDFACGEVVAKSGKAIKLNVSGPFHSRLMAPAGEIVSKNLESTTINKPGIPVVLNVTAKMNENVDEIKNSLVIQVSTRVRWRETISYFMDNGVKNIVEIGAGKVLTGMLKRVDHNFSCRNIGNIVELAEFLKS